MEIRFVVKSVVDDFGNRKLVQHFALQWKCACTSDVNSVNIVEIIENSIENLYAEFIELLLTILERICCHQLHFFSARLNENSVKYLEK